MNLNVPKDFFIEEYYRLMNINNYDGFDEHVIDVIKELKNASFIDKICPRWSCQGHSQTNRDSEYEIIFVTQQDGPDILYEMFQYMNSELVEANYGCAVTHFSVVHLINDSIAEKDAVPHLIIQMTSNGTLHRIDKFKNVWLKTIKEFSKRYNR